MNKISINMKGLACGIGLALSAMPVLAHDDNAPGTPVCLEANYMMADAQNTPFASNQGPGRVIEMNIITGQRGITVDNPFGAPGPGPVCDNGGVSCGGAPWKPTGVLSGGMNGHAYLTSAAQHAITEFHRDGTAIRTAPTLPTSPSPAGGNFGFVPRLLGSQIMPNGNLMQTVCDANFFNANNSDPFATGESAIDPANGNARPDNSSWQFFPPVYSTAEQNSNSRILVLDQETLEVIDEYSAPDDPRWSCPAGIAFTSEGMIVTSFHSAAAFIIDWKAGVSKRSCGIGCNKSKNDDDDHKGKHRVHIDDDDVEDDNHGSGFELDKDKNKARVIRVVDFLNTDLDGDGIQDAPTTFRMRSLPCLRGEAPGASPAPASGVRCNPRVFRQHVAIANAGRNVKTGTIAMDPGVNVIAGIRINRMSAPGCAAVEAEELASTGTNSGDACDVETLYVATSAANAGCDADSDGNPGPGHPANQCFKPGGSVYEYRIDTAHLDAQDGTCTGNPTGDNSGCAMPIAQFKYINAAGIEEKVDPRMLMPIHEAFIQ